MTGLEQLLMKDAGSLSTVVILNEVQTWVEPQNCPGYCVAILGFFILKNIFYSHRKIPLVKGRGEIRKG